MGKPFRIDVDAVDEALRGLGAVGVCAQARRIGITREQWGRICAGKVSTPRSDTLDKIITACDLPYSRVIVRV